MLLHSTLLCLTPSGTLAQCQTFGVLHSIMRTKRQESYRQRASVAAQPRGAWMADLYNSIRASTLVASIRGRSALWLRSRDTVSAVAALDGVVLLPADDAAATRAKLAVVHAGLHTRVDFG